MPSRLTQLAADVAALINTGSYAVPVTASAVTRPADLRAQDARDLTVVVAPRRASLTLVSRAALARDLDVDVAVIKGLDDQTSIDSQIDPLIALVEAIVDHVSHTALGAARVSRIAWDPIYQADRIGEERRFIAVLSLTYTS